MGRILKASVTPVASIFGSGFLIIAPILNAILGAYAWIGMLLVCLLAYAVGWTIRHNIMYVEPLLASGSLPKTQWHVEKSADVALLFAYCVSISLYIHVMVSFLLAGFGSHSVFWQHFLVVLTIFTIGLIGCTKGLSKLASVDKYALLITVVMIVVIILVFLWSDIQKLYSQQSFTLILPEKFSLWTIASVLGGTLIVIQGFETTRYLGKLYSAKMRVTACKFSQLFTSIIYLLFIISLTPWFHLFGTNAKANGLFLLVNKAFLWLAIPLVLVALLSQFSAAVADTIAGGEDLVEIIHNKLEEKHAYFIVCSVALLLSFLNTYTVLVLSSKAFALYYLLQANLAYRVTARKDYKFLCVIVQLILLYIIIFAQPLG